MSDFFCVRKLADKPVETNETSGISFDKTRLLSAKDRHRAINFGNVVVGVATVRYYVRYGTRGGAPPGY